jgi:phosphatidylcholine synthase
LSAPRSSSAVAATAGAPPDVPPSALRKAAAWGVHAYTASGALIAFVALAAIGEQRYAAAFRWLMVAMAIDCTDGALARAVAVKRVLPYYDGSRLDDIVDYLTYVMVPVVLMYQAGCFPPRFAGAIAAAPLLASAYGFCRSDAKTEDHYFRGFPSYWNVVAFYVLALRLSPAVASTWVLALSVLVFAPLKFLYPSRAPRFRALSLALGAVWAVQMPYVVWTFPTTPTILVWLSLAYPAYYCLMSFWLQATGRA